MEMGRLPSFCVLFAAHWGCVALLVVLIERDKAIFPAFVHVALVVAFQG